MRPEKIMRGRDALTGSQRAMCMLTASFMAMAQTGLAAVLHAPTANPASAIDPAPDVAAPPAERGVSTACSPADLAEPFGTLDASDVLEFLTRFGAGDESVDYATPEMQFDFSDVVEYLKLFSQGFIDFESMDLTTTVVVGTGATAQGVIMTGSAAVSSGSGDAIGSATMMFAGGSSASATFSGPTMSIATGAIIFEPGDISSPDIFLVDGSPVSAAVVMATFEADFAGGGSPGSWADTSRAMLAMAAFGAAPDFAHNVRVAACLDGVRPFPSRAPGFWCKAAAIGCGAAITAVLTTGCLVFTAGCAIGDVATFGTITIPCVVLIGLCAGGVFAGGAAAYEICLAYWGQ